MGTPGRPNARTLRLVLAAGLLVGTSFGCPKPQDAGTAAVRNDCQQDHLVIRTVEHDTITGADLPLVGPIADMPEYHDCQRFVVPAGDAGAVSAVSNDSLAFGPLVAIWAANELDAAFAGGSREGMAVPVAVIYNFETGVDYAPLGIQPGFSCLFLWNDGAWRARVVALGPKAPDSTDPSRCLAPIDTTSRAIVGGTSLEVVPLAPPAQLTAHDVPPVARWDWDAKHRRQYIGIRCGKEWCDVGTPGFTPAEPASDTPEGAAFLARVVPIPKPGVYQATPEEVLRVVAVKGWYDQQRLDLRDPGGTLTMSSVSGLVFPQPALDSVTVEAFASAWIPSAYVLVDDAYTGKIPMRAGVNRVDICNGTRTDCLVPDGASHCAGIDPDSRDTWWGRVSSDDGDPYYYCVRRREHGGDFIPAAAARWNWSEADAKTWTRCGPACCTGN